jgi:hypothetical protein
MYWKLIMFQKMRKQQEKNKMTNKNMENANKREKIKEKKTVNSKNVPLGRQSKHQLNKNMHKGDI